MLAKSLVRGLLIGGLTLASAGTLTPKSAQAQVAVEIAPARIETYPHTRYEDRDVYRVHDRWYYRNGPHWYYYRHEPRPLYHHRMTVIDRPRSHREYRGRRHWDRD